MLKNVTKKKKKKKRKEGRKNTKDFCSMYQRTKCILDHFLHELYVNSYMRQLFNYTKMKRKKKTEAFLQQVAVAPLK